MAVIDCFTYNGEREMLDLHLNILDEYVDKFILVEAKTTFSGKKKKLYFSDQEHLFRKWWPKITYHIVDEKYSPEEVELAESSPNTKGAAHWKNEFLQKESIKKSLKGLDDEDIVFVGDVDEIWHYPELFRDDAPNLPDNIVLKLKLRVYTYYLNNASSEEFYGPILTKYKNIKGSCLNHLRSTEHHKTPFYRGWHFTSMGGESEVRRKLTDSYTEETYAAKPVLDNLSRALDSNTDFLGRPFHYVEDESHWPQYLKDNKIHYQHLCREST